MTKRAHDEVGFTVGSGNVFRDLGLESPDEELSKARLARQIHDRSVALGLNGTQLAARLLIPQPKASRLQTCRDQRSSCDTAFCQLRSVGRRSTPSSD